MNHQTTKLPPPKPTTSKHPTWGTINGLNFKFIKRKIKIMLTGIKK